jgi:S1-C subfamily serine protease
VTSVLPPPPPPPAPPASQPHVRRPAGLLALAAATALAAAAFGGWWVGRDDASGSPTIVVPTVPATTVNQLQASGSGSAKSAQTSAGTIDVAAVAETVAPSVVTVSATIGAGGGLGEAVGTGVIISADGEILTNAHVVAGAQDVRVRFAGNTEPVPATIVAADPGNDLALLRVDIDADLPAVTIADPAGIRIGDPVVAIGFALDLDGDPSVTLGIVSALDRTLTINDRESLDGLIQTDAAISSGNSGGPLVSASGQLVGINTAVAESDIEVAATNVGFAIGAEEINEVLPLLRDGGERVPGFLGVILADRVDGGLGALVAEVTPGSPAADAGLRVSDVVVAVDDQPINGSGGLVGVIRDHRPGDEVSIVVVRDGAEVNLTAVLVDGP